MTVKITYPYAELESEIESVRRDERKAFEADDIKSMSALRARRLELQAQLEGAEREHVEAVPTGRTIGQVWSGLEPSERRDWLKLRGIKVMLSREAVTIVAPAGKTTLTTIGRTMAL
jgi:hypothetical protein